VSPAVTLDAIIDELGDIDLLKLDIEGAEYEVLTACRQLDRVRCIVGEVHTIPNATTDQFFSLLDGFSIVESDIHDGKGTFLALKSDSVAA
jgi:hypothetical protein